MFYAVCSTFNIWCFCPWNFDLFPKTNTQWHLLQLLSSGRAILYVFISSTQVLISNLTWKYSTSSLVSPSLLSLTWLPLAFSSWSPWIQWTHLVKGLLLLQIRGLHPPRAEGSQSFHHWVPPSFPKHLSHAVRRVPSNDSFSSWLKGLSNQFWNSPV